MYNTSGPKLRDPGTEPVIVNSNKVPSPTHRQRHSRYTPTGCHQVAVAQLWDPLPRMQHHIRVRHTFPRGGCSETTYIENYGLMSGSQGRKQTKKTFRFAI